MAHRNRRQFLKQSALAGVGFWAAGGVSAAEPKGANEKLNIALIGCGGQGGSNLGGVSSENIVALCDVDEKRAAAAFTKYPNVKKYADFRKMLEDQKDIDAVVVSTPDHMHAPASVMAMKLGKHVYCEKPLTWSVHEARVMRETAAKMKVATQMGNMGTAGSGFRQNVEVIQSGALGAVKEVHVWSNRPIWPQGMNDRPKDTPAVPDTLNWDLWLGVASDRQYHPSYLPFAWRGWWDFGTGALGDMACHTANLPFMALKLGYPTAIEAETSGISLESPPKWSVIRFDFPARGELPPVKFTWYDGGKKPEDGVLKPVLDLLGVERDDKKIGSGCLIVGDKGSLFTSNDYGQDRKLLPEEKFKDYKPPEPTLVRSPGHHKEWIQACKGGKAAMSNFDYAAFLTETILLGNIAMRVGKKIEWDGPNMKSTNVPEAEKFVKREYRKGWSL
ncbi:MAG: Gfo/Idh/MocA family oxidoreductase [Gemmataceae bacterium]|nr:Gfo/Idh/MocA family oxidoreductase [Gemmataceae bacterium]